MTKEDQHFASFAQDLEQLFAKYFEKGTQLAIAFAPLSDQEIRYVMNVHKPVGIALFEQAAELARKDMNLPYKITNPEKIRDAAKTILQEMPQTQINEEKLIEMIYREMETTLNFDKVIYNVKNQLLGGSSF